MAASSDVRLTMSKATFDRIQLNETTVDHAIGAGQLKVEGRREAADELLGMLDAFPSWFDMRLRERGWQAPISERL